MSSDILFTALNYLSRREYARRSLEAKLISKGFDEASVNEVLNRLQQGGQLSDERYVESYTQSRVRRGYGLTHIRRELTQAGVSEDVIQEGITSQGVNWEDVLEKVWERKFGVLNECSKVYAKQFRFLMQRGFSAESIHSLLKKKKEKSLS